MIKSFWYLSKNVGDTLTPIIVKYFTGQNVIYTKRHDREKLLAVGSVMSALKNGDTVWGTGIMREKDRFLNKDKCIFLAVRGKLTEKILGRDIGVYGDPALLLPIIYNPEIKQTHDIGFVKHYVDKNIFVDSKYKTNGLKFKNIDVEQDWQKFIRDIKSCKKIISSSLHGIIIAEAYGIKAEWMKGSDKIIGKGFKFRDYLTGTGRKEQEYGEFPPIENLKDIQYNLINSLKKHYGLPMDKKN